MAVIRAWFRMAGLDLQPIRPKPSASRAPLRAGRPRSRGCTSPVIPAKAGIQSVAAKPATRNQARTEAGGSLLPSWEKARMRVRRACARLCGRDARAPGDAARPAIPALWIPAKAGIQRVAAEPAIRNQARIEAGGSPLPSWERARVRVSPRASAALRAGRPRSREVKPAHLSGYAKSASRAKRKS